MRSNMMILLFISKFCTVSIFFSYNCRFFDVWWARILNNVNTLIKGIGCGMCVRGGTRIFFLFFLFNVLFSKFLLLSDPFYRI